MPKKTRRLPFILILLSFLAISLLSYLRVFDNYELSTLDLRFSLRPIQPQNADIAIIEIADDSIEKIGRWPFSRDWHASLINILSSYGVKMIIFDVIFSEPSEADASLIESTEKAGNVYYAYALDLIEKKYFVKTAAACALRTPLLESLEKVSKGSGHVNVLPDIDGKTRKITPFIKCGDKFYPHLGFLAARDYLGEAEEDVKFIPSKEIVFTKNNIRLPLDETSNMLVNFAGKWTEAFKHYSYIDILKSYSLIQKGQRPIIDLAGLKGKVCFIGLTGTGLHDLNPIPLESRYPSIGAHINTFNTITTEKFLRRANPITNLIILIGLLLLITATAFKLPGRVSIFSLLGILGIFGLIAFGVFIFFGIWIDLFYPFAAVFVVYLAATFYRFILEIYKRQLIERELGVATKIQASFLPERPPTVKGVGLNADMAPAKHVGGDLYDFVAFSENKVGVMIGDVSGKGVPAALYMAKTISEFRLFSKLNEEPKDVLLKLNENLARGSRTNLFVTMTYIIYDSRTRMLKFACGGHNPTILLRRGQAKLSYLDVKEGIPLGMMESPFGQESLALAAGDKLILYTDGVSEAKSKTGEEFGEKRLGDLILANASLSAGNLLLEIKNNVAKFSKGAPQHDDITAIVMEVK